MMAQHVVKRTLDDVRAEVIVMIEILYQYSDSMKIVMTNLLPCWIAKNVKKKLIQTFIEPQGEIVQYNNLYNLWKIDATDVTINTGSKILKCKRARFIFE